MYTYTHVRTHSIQIQTKAKSRLYSDILHSYSTHISICANCDCGQITFHSVRIFSSIFSVPSLSSSSSSSMPSSFIWKKIIFSFASVVSYRCRFNIIMCGSRTYWIPLHIIIIFILCDVMCVLYVYVYLSFAIGCCFQCFSPSFVFFCCSFFCTFKQIVSINRTNQYRCARRIAKWTYTDAFATKCA